MKFGDFFGGTELAFTAPGAFTFFTAPLTIAARSSQSESPGNLIATQLRVCEADRFSLIQGFAKKAFDDFSRFQPYSGAYPQLLPI